MFTSMEDVRAFHCGVMDAKILNHRFIVCGTVDRKNGRLPLVCSQEAKMQASSLW